MFNKRPKRIRGYANVPMRRYRLMRSLIKAADAYWFDPENVDKICAFGNALKAWKKRT